MRSRTLTDCWRQKREGHDSLRAPGPTFEGTVEKAVPCLQACLGSQSIRMPRRAAAAYIRSATTLGTSHLFGVGKLFQRPDTRKHTITVRLSSRLGPASGMPVIMHLG